MSSGKEIGEIVRDLEKAGLEVSQNGHYHVLGEQSQLLYTLPTTPGSQSSVRKSKIAADKLIRGEPVRPESDHSGRNTPGKAVSDEAQAPPAEETEQAGPIRRGDRRAQRGAEEAAEARAAERIQEKDRPKTPQAGPPKPRRVFVRPKKTTTNRLGAARLTSPSGQPAIYSSDVSRKNGKEVRPEDIHAEETLVFWPEAKKTGRTPSCFSCFAPGATGILYIIDVRWLDRRDIYLALGRPLKKAERMATQDHQSGSLRNKGGEYVGSGAMALCKRCHDRFARSGPPRGDCEWATIKNWQEFLAERVWVDGNGGVKVPMPGDPPFASD